jgi:putative transposase
VGEVDARPEPEEIRGSRRQFTDAYGLEKSVVSEDFIEASRTKLKDLMESRLDKAQLGALLVDATPFAGQQIVTALGIGQDGRKTILGIRQGATENATVVGELWGDRMNRGLDFTQPRLYVLDGGKALTGAVKKYAGESAAIQRCQVHKRRNVVDHLPDEQQPAVAKQLTAAYALEDHAAARQALNASTNVIESAFSIVERVCRNLKRWHRGDFWLRRNVPPDRRTQADPSAPQRI